MTRITEYRTPGERLWWSNVREWCNCGYVLNRCRLSYKRSRDLETHGMCMPLDLVLPAWPYWHPPPAARTSRRSPLYFDLSDSTLTLLHARTTTSSCHRRTAYDQLRSFIAEGIAAQLSRK